MPQFPAGLEAMLREREHELATELFVSPTCGQTQTQTQTASSQRPQPALDAAPHSSGSSPDRSANQMMRDAEKRLNETAEAPGEPDSLRCVTPS